MKADKIIKNARIFTADKGNPQATALTCAHLEIEDDSDLNRFAKLGVIANFTPWWHGLATILPSATLHLGTRI